MEEQGMDGRFAILPLPFRFGPQQEIYTRMNVFPKLWMNLTMKYE
jgi:hypothetical protein